MNDAPTIGARPLREQKASFAEPFLTEPDIAQNNTEEAFQ
jgi:hypothetical protein